MQDYWPDDAARCVGRRSALHRPSQRAATGIAAQWLVWKIPCAESPDGYIKVFVKL